ncbi:MAG TPA: hypothetical protein VFA18_20130 [Gemmataceae bacterium]|nr:hypothetical protein [Gemmataceae bacterium]
MELVRCEVSEGPRVGYVAVGVKSIEGHTEFLTIEDRLLAHRGDERYLPVSVVGKDKARQTALVQLPAEADSGANRVWVRTDDLVLERDEVPA